MVGGALSLAFVALLSLWVWSPWSSDDDDWVKQINNKSEQVQDPASSPKSPTPAEEKKVLPPQEKIQEHDKKDEPVMYAEEEAEKKEEKSQTLDDIAIHEEIPAEAERFSSLTSDKESLSQDYKNLIKGARMIASDLDVRVESSSLKEYNNTHFDRVADMLRRPEYQGKELYLVGIAGSVETHFIAKSRADFARQLLLEKYKLPISISTFGFDTHTEEPARGRRLEVWVK